jgi:hypothetical protein
MPGNVTNWKRVASRRLISVSPDGEERLLDWMCTAIQRLAQGLQLRTIMSRLNRGSAPPELGLGRSSSRAGIMQHGLYMLQGQGIYLLGTEDWHECWTGDFIWMGSFCPQFFIATGWEEAQYLRFKNDQSKSRNLTRRRNPQLPGAYPRLVTSSL